jgi:hypothetical protein
MKTKNKERCTRGVTKGGEEEGGQRANDRIWRRTRGVTRRKGAHQRGGAKTRVAEAKKENTKKGKGEPTRLDKENGV